MHTRILQRTWQVVFGLMKQELDKFMADVPIQLVRQLYEFTGANPVFEKPIVDGETVSVRLCFTCDGQIRSVTGLGKNKENAKRAAAKLALRTLKG